MRPPARYLSFALLCCSTALTALAVRVVVVGTSADEADHAPPLGVDAREKDFGVGRVGQKAFVRFTFTNRSHQPLTLIGASELCHLGGCVSAESDLPVEILPGDSLEFVVYCLPSRTGPYEAPISVYTNSPGQTEIELTVRGEAAQ